MRKVYLFLLALICMPVFSLTAQDVEGLQTFENSIKPGTVLTYDVDANGKKYQFIVTIKKLGDEIMFDWQMTDPINKSGSVDIARNAVASADALYNYFTGGLTVLDKETSVWISKKTYADIDQNAQAFIRINGAADTATLMTNTITEFGFTINGEYTSMPGWEIQSTGTTKYTIDIIESTKFPIIYRMDLGWTIVLSDIKNP